MQILLSWQESLLKTLSHQSLLGLALANSPYPRQGNTILKNLYRILFPLRQRSILTQEYLPGAIRIKVLWLYSLKFFMLWTRGPGLRALGVWVPAIHLKVPCVIEKSVMNIDFFYCCFIMVWKKLHNNAKIICGFNGYYFCLNACLFNFFVSFMISFFGKHQTISCKAGRGIPPAITMSSERIKGYSKLISLSERAWYHHHHHHHI